MKDSSSNSPTSSRELIIATTNAGKLNEIIEQLSVLEIPLLSLNDFQVLPEATETGTTFEENARLKAKFYYDLLKRPVLAEDSGLVIPALGGFPGVHSARIADDDPSRIRCVLDKLEELEKDFSAPNSPDLDFRSAYYVSSLVFLDGTSVQAVEGRCHGTIARIPVGTAGFGYDPIFIPENFPKTFAELTSLEKTVRSHRGEALRAILPYLRKRFYPEEGNPLRPEGGS
jgi:non-canonical purine NTP pyrophosphatase (RdgB/HAM1 family)